MKSQVESNDAPIGLFDSGIGGLGIAHEINQLLPHESIVYLADVKNCPYGTKKAADLKKICASNTKRLVDAYACKMIVVACNTATSVAIKYLRAQFPIVPIIGVVPVIKTAVTHTKMGCIAVLSTPNTIKSKTYKELIDAFAGDVDVISIPCPRLAEAIEKGEVAHKLGKMVRDYCKPFHKRKFDVVVLGCTHYTLIKPVIQKVFGDDMLLLDSNKAVARHVKRVLEQEKLLSVNMKGITTYHGISKSRVDFINSQLTCI